MTIKIEDKPAVIRVVSYAVEDLHDGGREFTSMMETEPDWKVLEGFRIEDGRFIIMLVKEAP